MKENRTKNIGEERTNRWHKYRCALSSCPYSTQPQPAHAG